MSTELQQMRVAGALVLIGLVLSAAGGLLSHNGILQFDDLTHYLYAKWAWHWPVYLLDNWGRPGFTVMYFLPAAWGWPACRILSAILTAGSAWLAFRIAAKLGVQHAWAVVPLAYVQPLFFQLSETTLTETPLALYLTLGVYLALRGKWSWSAAVVSIGAVTRHEAVIYLPIWLFAAWWSHVPLRRLWPIVWAPVSANVLAFICGAEPMLKPWFVPEPSTQYGHGSWLTYFGRALHAFGPGVAVLAMTGMSGVVRRRGGGLIVSCIVTYFAAHTIIRALGLFASGGYARFLAPVAPLVAIAALQGWLQLWQSDGQRRRRAVLVAATSMIILWLSAERLIMLHKATGMTVIELPSIHDAKWAVRIIAVVVVLLALIAAVGTRKGRERLSAFERSHPWHRRHLWHRRPAGETTDGTPAPQVHFGALILRTMLPASLVGIIALTCYALCRPLQPPPEAILIDEMRSKLAEKGLGDRRIISANIWIDYVTGRALPYNRPSVRGQLERAEIGTLFAWERQFAGSPDYSLSLDEIQSSGAFRLVLKTGPLPYHREPYLRVFEKTGEWGLPEMGHSRLKNRRPPSTATQPTLSQPQRVAHPVATTPP